MGELIAVFKVMPQGVETDLGAVEKGARDAIPGNVSVENVAEEPVAFGLKALKFTLLMEDSEDVSVDAIEQALQGVDGVESVSVEDVGRV